LNQSLGFKFRDLLNALLHNALTDIEASTKYRDNRPLHPGSPDSPDSPAYIFTNKYSGFPYNSKSKTGSSLSICQPGKRFVNQFTDTQFHVIFFLIKPPVPYTSPTPQKVNMNY